MIIFPFYRLDMIKFDNLFKDWFYLLTQKSCEAKLCFFVNFLFLWNNLKAVCHFDGLETTRAICCHIKRFTNNTVNNHAKTDCSSQRWLSRSKKRDTPGSLCPSSLTSAPYSARLTIRELTVCRGVTDWWPWSVYRSLEWGSSKPGSGFFQVGGILQFVHIWLWLLCHIASF